jgi:hypothetical protein
MESLNAPSALISCSGANSTFRPVVPPRNRSSPHDLVAQRAAVLGHAVEGAAVGMGDVLGGDQDAFEQGIEVALLGKCRTDRIELIESAEKVADEVYRHVLIPVRNTPVRRVGAVGPASNRPDYHQFTL